MYVCTTKYSTAADWGILNLFHTGLMMQPHTHILKSSQLMVAKVRLRQLASLSVFDKALPSSKDANDIASLC